MASTHTRARAIARIAFLALVAAVFVAGLAPVAGAQAAGVQPAANPPFPTACGLDVAVVIDTSASITDPSQGGDVGNPTVIKDATKQFIDTLTGTPSSVGVFSFRTAARTESGITDVRTAAGAATVKAAVDGIDFSKDKPAFFPPGVPYPAPDPAQANIADQYGTIGGTNWQDGFSIVSGRGADVVVFVTDGNPTTWSGDATQSPPDPGFVPGEPEDLDAGITAANALKAQGTRVVAVGIGTSGNLASFNPDNLKLVSGPTLDDDYYLIGDFGLLAATLDRIVLRSCAPSISVVKYLDTANGPVAAPGWEFQVALDPVPAVPPGAAVTDPGGAVNFAWDAQGDTQVVLTETLQPGYRFVGASCTDRRGADWPVTQAANGIGLTVGFDNIIRCEFHNEALPAGISLVKTPSTTEALVGETVTYTYTVTNTGGVPLTGLTLSDDKLGPITLATTDLAAGASTTGTATTTVVAGNLPGPLVNVATVTGTAPDESTVTATDDASVSLAAITVVKQADQGIATVGQTVTYTYTVTNTGSVALSGISLSDDKLGPITLAATTLAPGASTTGTATKTVTSADLTGGAVINLATVTGTTPGGKQVTDDDDEKVDLAAIALTKVPDLTSASVGDTITYTYTITNTGTVELSTLGLTDDKLGALTPAVDSLAPGASTTATATHVVTAADGEGPIVNVATVTGITTIPDRVTGLQDQVTATATATVGIVTVLPTTVTSTTVTSTTVEVLPETGEDTGILGGIGILLLLGGLTALGLTRRRRSD